MILASGLQFLGSAIKSPIKPPTNGMTPIYLEPKPEPYLVHHLENSQSCSSNTTDNGTAHSSVVGGSPSMSLPLTATKQEGSMKMEEPVVVKNDDLSTARSTATNISNNQELTNMQPAPPSSYNPYSPMQYNGVGV